MLAVKQLHLMEIQKLQKIVDSDIDKKSHFDILAGLKASEEKNRLLMQDIMVLRKQLSDKET